MRFFEKASIVISKDTNSVPTQVRFSEEFQDIDITSIVESKTLQETFPVGTTAISFGAVVTAKLIIIKPTSTIEYSVSGGANQKALAGKLTKLWTEASSLSLIVTTTPVEVALFIGGE